MEKYGLKADVNVYAKPGDDWRMPDDIKTIEVVLSKQKSAGSVEPVVIDTTKPPALPEGDASLAEEVRAFLAGRWEIDEDKIDVQFRGGNRGGCCRSSNGSFLQRRKTGKEHRKMAVFVRRRPAVGWCRLDGGKPLGKQWRGSRSEDLPPGSRPLQPSRHSWQARRRKRK